MSVYISHIVLGLLSLHCALPALQVLAMPNQDSICFFRMQGAFYGRADQFAGMQHEGMDAAAPMSAATRWTEDRLDDLETGALAIAFLSMAVDHSCQKHTSCPSGHMTATE